MKTYEDDELVSRYRRNGEPAALDVLFKRHKSSVFGLAYYYMKSKDLAMDVVMDVFEIVIKSIKQKEISNFKYWLLAIARNQCLKRLRDTMKVVSIEDSESVFVESTTAEVYSDEDIDQLLVALRKLKKTQQECIVAFYLKGLSYKDIAKTYDIDEKKVKSHIQNGKRNLRLLLTRPNSTHG